MSVRIATISRVFVCALMFCCGMASAQPGAPLQAPPLQSGELPIPPQQHAPWPHGDDVFSNAAATLFEQGLADPRGLEYREIEIAIDSPRRGTT
jgi:hypothetical protein